MIRTILAATVLSATVAQPVLALSCRAPDVARTTQAAMEADATYRIVTGILTFDALTPPFDGNALGDNEAASIPARFTGNALTASGFDDPTQSTITLTATCLMQSCGMIEPDVRTLMFLRAEDGEAVLELDPCAQWAFPTPTDAQLRTVVDCITGDCPTG